MKLYVNQTSPYARKARMVVIEKGLSARVQLVDVDPWLDPPALLAVSPLSKVPVLDAGDGRVLTESDTICRYLDGNVALPVETIARMALLQGMIDAAFDAVIEKRRPAAMQWPEWVSRQQRAVERGLAVVAAQDRPDSRFDLGDISLASLLGYLDFRHPTLDWRGRHSALGAWFDALATRPSVASTHPEVAIA